MLPLRQTARPEVLETVAILRKTNSATRALAELKGVCKTIPQPDILVNTLAMQEAKDSSAIENIITTHDEMFKDDAFPEEVINPAAKEILRYRQALRTGFELVKKQGLLTSNHILSIQRVLEQNTAGFRKLPGTTLQDGTGSVIYTPPQDAREILNLMADLEAIINEPEIIPIDPIVKMAIIHHQFESIHPFYDGNGRTGRIINVLYLIKEGLLDIPVLYLSRYIVQNKTEYYRLLQSVRDENDWEPWVIYMLEAVEKTSRETVETIERISSALLDYKRRIRSEYSFYSQDLINSLFYHPYTKISFIERDLKVSRNTASRYLDILAKDGFLEKNRIGRSNYYINKALNEILTRTEKPK